MSKIPESFVFRILHNSLNELGFGGLADQLVEQVHEKGLFIDSTSQDLLYSSKKAKLYQWITQEVYSGRYDNVLDYLDQNMMLYTSEASLTAEVGGKPNLAHILAISIEDIADPKDLVPVVLVAKYFIKRTIFLQKLVDFSLDRSSAGAGNITNNSLIQYLSDQLSPILDVIDVRLPLVQQLFNSTVLANLNREAESSKLLSLVMQSPLTDFQVEKLVFGKEIMFSDIDISDNAPDYFVSLLRKTLVKVFLGSLFARDFYESALPYSNFQVQGNFLNKIINDSVLYTQSQNPYYLPSRTFSDPSNTNGTFIPPIDSQLKESYAAQFPSTLLKTLKCHTGEVWACKFSPSGRYLVTGAADGQLIIYDVRRNFEPIETLVSDNNLDRQRFVNSTYKPYTSSKSIIYCAWDHNEDYIISGSLDTRVRVWNVKGIKNRNKTVKRTTRSTAHQTEDSDEPKLVSCFILGEKIRTWSCEFLPPVEGEVPAFIIGSPDKVLKAFDIRGIELFDFYSNSAIGIDGRMYEDTEEYGEDDNGHHTDESDEENEFEGSRRSSANSRTLPRRLSSKSESRDLTFPEYVSAAENRARNFNRVNDICITPNGKILITANSNKQVAFYTIPDLGDANSSTRKIATLTVNARLTSCSVNSDGTLLLLSLSPGELQVWNIKDLDHNKKPTLFKKLIGHTHVSYMIRSCFGYNYNNSEQLALSGGDDGDIFIWKVNTGALVTRLNGHQNVCNSVSWNNGYQMEEDYAGLDYGKLWCSVGDDKLVKIWGPPDFYN